MKCVTLFCDGSSLGNPGFGGWCGILRYGNHQKILRGGAQNATNNQMELMALIQGLEALKEPCEVLVVCDSKYCYLLFLSTLTIIPHFGLIRRC